MRSVFSKIVFAFTFVLLMAAFVVPAQAKEVKTAYFTLDLPAGWTQPRPVQEVNGAVVALVVNQKDGTAVSISVMPAPMTAEDIAKQTLDNMKKGGMKVEEPKEKDGLYEAAFSQGAGKGMSWFGSNGTVCAVTTVVGKSVEPGKALLKGLKSSDDKLFPKF